MRRIESARKSGFLGGVPVAAVTLNRHCDSKPAGKLLNSPAATATPPVNGLEETIEIFAGNSAFFNSEY